MKTASGTAAGLAVASVVLLAVAIGGGIVVWRHTARAQSNGLPETFEYDLDEIKRIDPALVRYRQTAEVLTGMEQVRGVAVGPDDRIYVAGDQAVRVFDRRGAKQAEIALEGEPRCLAVGDAEHVHPGHVYVGMKTRIEVYDPAGKRLAAWDDLGEKAILTSIALAEQEVLVADAGHRIVHRFGRDGKSLGQIGKRDEARGVPGFIIPSPYFDAAVTADGLVRVANPGRHRIEGYTPDGHLEVFWGKSGTAIDRFCGCCNPANFALLPDGRFVTAEKGVPRVKVYSADGQFQCVVAGPQTLAPTETITEETRDEHRLPVFDVAADSRGRVLVLDPVEKKVRVFEESKDGM